MLRKKGQAVGPVKRRADVRRVREHMRKSYRHGELYALMWACGCNLGLRAGDLRELTAGVLQKKGPIAFTERKNGRRRVLYANASVRAAYGHFLRNTGTVFVDPGARLFWGQKGTPLQVKHMHRVVKESCAAVGLRGNYGSHTMRKTFGYHAYRRSRTAQNLRLVMEAFGHTQLKYTQAYTGVDDGMGPHAGGNPRRTLEDLYMSLNL